MIERKSKLKPFEKSKRHRQMVNTKINVFKDFTEIVHYDEPFQIKFGQMDYEYFDTSTGQITSAKKYHEQENNTTLDKMEQRIKQLQNEKRSSKRSKDKFYGYGLANDWVYWCTFTIAYNQHDTSDTATKYYWQLFRQKLQYKFDDIKILAVPERHKKNSNFHFHSLLGNCDLEPLLVISVNQKTGRKIKDRSGRQCYDLPLWDKGFSRVVKLDQTEESIVKTISYMIGYLTKENDTGFNQRKYYRTFNLDYKDVELTMTSKRAIEKKIANKKVFYQKSKNGMTVYRFYHDQTQGSDL